MQVGGKVSYLGLCYKVTSIKSGMATIAPLRTSKKNPRSRPSFRQIKVEDLKPWKAAA